MRKLVTVRTVAELRPIEGADLIELAIIDGWQCVVKKDEFKVGDKGLYFEVDSFLPGTDSRYEFLKPRFTVWNNKEGARIRTMKLRGALSQGLLLPLKDFPEIKSSSFIWEKDYADELGVLKWEREDISNKVPEPKHTWLGRKFKKLKYTKLKPLVLWLERTFPSWFTVEKTSPFPSFIPKTDEERIQNLIGKLDLTKEEDYAVTIKLDGSSLTAYYNRGKVGVCSRNLDLKKDPENKFWSVVLELGLEKALKKLGKNIAIQGELMGPGIQGNREELKSHNLYVYKIFDIDRQQYLGLLDRTKILGNLYELDCELDVVPFLGLHKLSEFKNIDDFLAFAEGPSLHTKSREGVVFDRIDGKKGFKVINNSYLLKHGE